MIKVEVIENFTLEDYNKLKNVKKVISRKENEFGVRDTFECDEKMVDYLTGNNPLNKVVVKVIEVEPEVKVLSQSPVEELEKAVNVKAEITTANYSKSKKKKASKK